MPNEPAGGWRFLDFMSLKDGRAEIRRMIREQLALEGTNTALDAADEEPQASDMKPGMVAEAKPTPKQKQKKKRKGKEQLKEEGGDEPEKAPSTSAVAEPSPKPGRKLKRGKAHRAEAAPQVEEAEAPQREPKKRPKRKAQKEEQPSKAPKAAKTKRSKGASPAATDAADLHPSWNAKKAAKVSGAIVEAAGDRKVFDSDSDA
ncbi:tea1 [Symbiodinium natans]|uniref:Tea1 protein n=1 Tax=Symbiodinium natans TaxID=878477 RepID=A0A812PM53_9DINO|nr:tea1 [Symbiodinium natans]